ncbi:hypothetical protein BC830DRAFT_1094106 [Chytriomyces sp. MP71]|nr:hypothetical protein BC830DRAFT_1094106 [Chytriomyces sp. MP71]
MAATPGNTKTILSKCQFILSTVTSVTPNSKARIPAYLLTLNPGEALLREHTELHKKPCYTSSAQLTSRHTPDELTNSLLLTLVNFPRKQIGPKMSDCLVTGVQSVTEDIEERRKNTVVLIPLSCAAVPLPSLCAGMAVSAEANPEPVTSNKRDLAWDEFAALHIRVGTVTHLVESRGAEHILEVDFGTDIGARNGSLSLSEINGCVTIDEIQGHQVLAVIQESGDARLFTVEGRTVLIPAQPVENGFKLA